MARDQEDEDMRQIAIRLPVSALERLEAHARRLKDERPGVSATRADALRSVILVGLDKVEQDAKTTRAKTTA